MEYILKFSPFLRNEENEWMKSVIHIIRTTSLYFSPDPDQDHERGVGVLLACHLF